jgi:hypothetical protein
MKFLKPYKIYKDILNENKKHALSVLKKLHISKDNNDFKSIERKLWDSFDSTELLGILTKFRFIENVSLDEILDLIKWLHDNNGNKLLPKPIQQYKTFESLKDDIINIDTQRKVKLVLKELPSEQSEIYKISSIEQRNEFNQWCVKLHEIKYKLPFYKKISSIKTMDEMISRISDFVLNNLDIKDYDEKKKELEETPKVDIVLDDTDNGVLIARILNYEASNKLGSSSWCISTGQGTWVNYIYNNMGYQYFIWDYSKSIADPLHQIGVTLGVGNRVTHAHDVNDTSLIHNLPDVITNNLKNSSNIDGVLVGMTLEEADKIKGEYRGEKRKMTKVKFDNETGLKELATILMEYLKEENLWVDELDVYDLTPSHDYYGMTHFDLDLIDEERSYCIADDDQADKAYSEWIGGLIDDTGYLSWPRHVWEGLIDKESIIRQYGGDFEEAAEYYIEEDEYDTEEEYEAAKEQWVEDRREEIEEDPLEYLIEHDFLKEESNVYGYNYMTAQNGFDASIMFDREEFIEAVKDDRGVLGGYDGVEGTIEYNDTWYYIYRTN